METLTKSLIRLIKNKKNHQKNDFELEIHFFFDDSFDKTASGKVTNKWVNQYLEVLERVLPENSQENIGNQGELAETPYGGRIRLLVFGVEWTIHLKDSEKIKKGLRWTQVMYMNYVCHWKIKQEKDARIREENSFILAIDGDVDFRPVDFDLVLSRMLDSSEIAACCSQIEPTGSGPMVWFQHFEYGIQHYSKLFSEKFLGSVLCTSHCFCILRMSALKPVLKDYAKEASDGRTKIMFDPEFEVWQKITAPAIGPLHVSGLP
ncbi:Oidioi.mRNA.OKI2018_I69.chr1.g1552.t1.cds [Oikopleura dioica]|uniref:Oidioi.mRNA.OKI2018_I69.chr1.g1552.t1.cds n=1 Tax=Oikopleura dioica TaxID=34765 RepID=A0ABN7STC6_OIKDI|nr:Oidioi.mRNA.OKI2018_I69.chr1.g1552.t1.cds [Oikopleura dioica]